MDKNSLESMLDSLKKAGIKSASALREFLYQTDKEHKEAAGGALSARDRINEIFDKGTFSEYGAYVRRRSSEFDAGKTDEFEGVICGWGAVNGRLVYCFAQDYTRTKGALSEAHAKKIKDIYKLALENGAPIIGIFDSAGALLPEGTRALAGYSTIMNCAAKASGVCPQIAIIPGHCAGAASVIAGMFDFVILSEDNASLSFNPPFVLDLKNDKAAFSSEFGLAALLGKNDSQCIEKARALLSYLPSNNSEGSVTEYSNDEINRLCDISAYKSSRNLADIICAFSDDASFFEIYSEYAPEAAVGFISLAGMVVGIAANRYSENGGILTPSAARKISKMISFCDSFNIPVITIVDCTGTDNSIDAEKTPYAAEIAKLAHTYATAKTPLITLIAGEAYGTVFSVMGSKSLGADLVYSLESAKIGVMNAASAVAFMHNDKISESVSREDLEKAWDEYVASPVSAASSGEIDDIISDNEIRQRLAAALLMLSCKSKENIKRRHANFPL